MSFIKHGQYGTPEYSSWQRMRARCNNPNHKYFYNYGGRGIKVCKRWDKFENFLKDMGERPSLNHSLDRKNSNSNYTLANCKWSTKTEQQNNTRRNIRINFNKESKTLSEWCRVLNLNYNTAYARIYTYKWDIEKAFSA